ncbi:MAG: hypothetical protein KAV48_04065 [Methanomicrobia archaeon]|nr:hypothetical protein [Methanomicrobia archaeon]MCK4433089.1 hypothetical protein [Methanomicrobia archaeon]MCK4637307.1 hypothetical protein [Methanomicrobia archaeon]
MRKIVSILLIIFLTGCTVRTFSINDAMLCTEVTNGKPSGIGTSFPNAGTVYCWLEYTNAPENTTMKAIWYYEGEKMYEKEIKLQSKSGSIWFSIFSTEYSLPHGNYRVDIYVDDQLKKEMEFSITQ